MVPSLPPLLPWGDAWKSLRSRWRKQGAAKILRNVFVSPQQDMPANKKNNNGGKTKTKAMKREQKAAPRFLRTEGRVLPPGNAQRMRRSDVCAQQIARWLLDSQVSLSAREQHLLL